MSRAVARARAGSVPKAADDAPASARSRPTVHPRAFPHHWAARPEEVLS
jgi:hypothetical protein